MDVPENGASPTTASETNDSSNSPTPVPISTTGRQDSLPVINGDLEDEDIYKRFKQLQEENAVLKLRLEKAPSRHASVRRSGSIAMKVALFSQGRPVQASESEEAMEAIAGERPESPIAIEDAIARLEGLCTVGAGTKVVEVEVAVLNSVLRHLQQGNQQKSADVTSPPTLLKPSAWAERERKYKRDLEEFEITIIEQRLQIKELNVELQQYRDGAQIRPLEQRIQELESQLKNSAAANTDLQSRLHDLTLKHRNLIETSPAMAAMWREVLVEQTDKKASALRQHRETLLSMGLSPLNNQRSSSPTSDNTGSSQPGSPGPSMLCPGILPEQLRSVREGKTIFESGDGTVPLPPPEAEKLFAHKAASAEADAPAGAEGRDTEGGDSEGAIKASLWSVASSGSAPPPASPSPAAERRPSAAQAAAVAAAAAAAKGGDEAGEAVALRAVNDELTEQLELYQQMVGRLREALEAADLDRAALEAQREQLLQQLKEIGVSGGAAASAAAAASANAAAAAGGATGGESRWQKWFRKQRSTSNRTSETGGDPTLWQSIETSSLEAMHQAAEGGTGEDKSPGDKLRDVVLDTMASKLKAAPAVQEVLDAMRHEVNTLRNERKTLRSEASQLGHQLAEAKLALAMAAEEALVFRRNLARAMEKESTLELKISTLQDMLSSCLPPSPAPSGEEGEVEGGVGGPPSFRSGSNPPSPLSATSPPLPLPTADSPELPDKPSSHLMEGEADWETIKTGGEGLGEAVEGEEELKQAEVAAAVEEKKEETKEDGGVDKQ